MKSSDILLSLDNEYLVVDKYCGIVRVSYQNAEIKDGMFLITAWGSGRNFEEACDNYLSKIRGKTLVFNAYKDNRKEVRILG